MTVYRAKSTFADAQIPSLFDVEALVRTRADPPIAKRRPQLLTSLRRLAQYGCADPKALPFVAPALRSALARMTPVKTGLTKKSLQNDASNIRFLLDHLGLGGLRQYKVPLTGEYEVLWRRLADRHEKSALSRFFRFACAQGVALQSVDDTFAESYRQALGNEGVIRDPEDSYRVAIRAWNRIAERWPELQLRHLSYPLKRRGWALPWSAFPISLVDEVEHYFTVRSEAGDLFDPDAPDVVLKPRTIETQKDWLRVLASAAVRSGVPIDSLDSLEALVRPGTVERALRWYIQDHGAKLTEYVVMLAVQAHTVARNACSFSEEECDTLARLIGRLRRRSDTDSDEPARLVRLRQFESQTNVFRMLALGDHVVRTVRKRRNPSRRDPVDISLALAHELLLATTIRRGNLVGLNLETHFIWRDDGRRLVHIPGNEVKNGDALHKELPPHVVKLLDLFLEDYRPRLCDRPSPWLFPGRKGRHKRPHTFTMQYGNFLRDWANIEATPHLIRSFADMLYTERHPEGGEVMRRQLGHRSADTRLKHYADPVSRAANRTYLELLIEEREKAVSTIGLFR